MWKKLGLSVVACGVMLGVAGLADAGTVPLRNVQRASAQRTMMTPHKKTVRTHKAIQHRHSNVKKTSFQSNVARRGIRGYRHHHHHYHTMYRMS